MPDVSNLIRCLFAAGLAMTCHAAHAADYPNRPIRFVLPFAPGGPTDTVARQFGTKLGEVLGQQVVPDNRGGAAGIVACEIAARAIPDGYTLLLATVGTQAINPHIYAKLPYDPLRDFATVSYLTASPYILLVNPQLPVKSVKELITYAKSRPGQMNFSSGGVGTGNHLSGELFKLGAGINITHVPYKGSSLALNDLIANQIQMTFINILPATPHMASGRVRGLAVTSGKRTAAAPEIPTVAESGLPGYETTSWRGIVVPLKTPKPLVTRLHQELARIARMPDVKEKLASSGTDVIGSTPEEFTAFIKAEYSKWGEVIRKAGIKAD